MSKRYYWLKLKNDFFNQREIKKLRRIAGGDTFTIIYLKMQLLSIQSEGVLKFEGTEESLSEQLALELDEDEDNIKLTLAFLSQNNLIEQISDSEFLMPQATQSLGSEVDSAERVRRHRDKKALQCNTDVTQSNDDVTKCNTEIENRDKRLELENKDREREKNDTPTDTVSDTPNDSHDDSSEPAALPEPVENTEKESKKNPKHKYGEYKHVLLTDEEYMKLQRDFQNAKELITYLDEHIEMKNYKANSHYLAIRKWVVDAVEETKLRKQRNRGGSGYDGRAGTDRQDTDKSHSFGTTY